jgi:hypothetical protein
MLVISDPEQQHAGCVIAPRQHYANRKVHGMR